jgi:putative SOS response-associated peptidase YedK
MCHRISPLVIAELKAALEELGVSGHARIPRREPGVVVPDVYPGRQLPLFVTNGSGALEAVELTWGFDAPPGTRSKLVFNTRIETALSQARSGTGLWAAPITLGRCLVPVRGFFEHYTRSSERRGEQWRFTYPGHNVFLLAGVWENDRVSVVTTVPNADVSPIHTRMPLVLAPGESSVWLGPDFARLADRSAVRLVAEKERTSQ